MNYGQKRFIALAQGYVEKTCKGQKSNIICHTYR